MRVLLLLLLLGINTAWAAGRVAVVGLMSDRAIIRVDGEQRLLKVGESVGDITLVAVNAQEAVLRIQGKEQRFGLGMATGGLGGRETQSVVISINQHGQYITSGMINGRVAEFLVDTGANTVSMTTADARALGLDYLRLGQEGQSHTAGGVVRSWRMLLDNVKVGPIVVRGVEANVREAPRLSPILLGMSFLSRVNLSHEQDRLRLSSR